MSTIAFYCERTDASFWSEPWNALTNLAFILGAAGAAWLWFQYRETAEQSVLRTPRAYTWFAWLLIVDLGLIGVGSFLFHSLATFWSLLADVIPIFVFIFLYVHGAMAFFWRLQGWRLALADLAGAGVVLLPAPFLVALARPEFQGSMGYVPPLLFLAGVGLYFLGRTPQLGRDLLIPTVILTVSLIFRSLDLPLCQEALSGASGTPGMFMGGTHFIWHILNGLGLFLLIRVLLVPRRLSPPSRP